MVREEQNKEQQSKKGENTKTLTIDLPEVVYKNVSMVALEDNREVDNYIVNAVYDRLRVDFQRFGFVGDKEEDVDSDD